MLLLPVFALVLSVGGVFAYKIYSDRTKPQDVVENTVPVNKVVPALQTGTTKPATGYGAMQTASGKASETAQISLQEPAVTPTPKPQTKDLDALLQESEDTAESDFCQIYTAAQSH